MLMRQSHMKPLPLILTMTALVLPIKARETPVWKTMDNGELKAFAETIVQNIRLSPEVAFGKTGDLGKSRLRVRTYPRGDQELLVVESSIPKDSGDRELIRSIQLKRVKDDGSVELVWEVLHGKPGPVPAHIPVRDLRWIIEQKGLEAPWRNGPTDVPAEKLFRSVS